LLARFCKMRMRERLFRLRNFSAQFYRVLNRLSGLRCIAEWRSFEISTNLTVTIFGLNLALHFSVYSCISGGGEETCEVDCIWNVMAHAQKPDFVFRRKGRVHLNRRGRQFSRLLTAEVCASASVMLDTPCSEVVWRVLATHSIHQFPLHFPSRASPCAIRFQTHSNGVVGAVEDDSSNL
jgi:hypothetical protein